MLGAVRSDGLGAPSLIRRPPAVGNRGRHAVGQRAVGAAVGIGDECG